MMQGFTIFETNLDWGNYFGMLALVVIWVLGFKTITTKGKIGHFIQRFFEKEIPRREPVSPQGAQKYDEEILARIKDKKGDEAIKAMRDYLQEKNIHFDFIPEIEVLRNILSDTPNKYFYYKSVRRFPDKLVDPIIGCPTCMPSLHGLILYTICCYYFFWWFNPLEWLVIAIPATFFTEQLWKLRNLLDRKINKNA